MLTASSALPLQKETVDRNRKRTMPAKDIMPLFRERKLHSGGDGKIVTDPHQARAIQLSYLRKEGHDIPQKPAKRKSFGEKIAGD